MSAPRHRSCPRNCRGYFPKDRFVLLEAGHLAENFYLVAASLRLAVVAVGGFFDDVVNRTLAVDGVDEAAVYLLVFGYPPRTDQNCLACSMCKLAKWPGRAVANEL